MDNPGRSLDNTINLRAVAYRVCDNLLWDNRVERFQTLSRETLLQCISDTRDEILSDEDWLEGDWNLAD